MFPKACVPYQLHAAKPWAYDAETLQPLLENFKWSELTEQDYSRYGFVCPLPTYMQQEITAEVLPLVYQVNNVLLFKIRRDERVIPPSYINQLVNKKVAEFEKENCTVISKKEYEVIKEEVILSLIKTAPYKTDVSNFCIDMDSRMLLFMGTSRSRAESDLALLRKSVGSLPVMPVDTMPIDDQLTCLLAKYLARQEEGDDHPEWLVVGDLLIGDRYSMVQCSNGSKKDGEKQSGTKADLMSPRFAAALNEKFVITKLEIGIVINSISVYFTLNANGSFSGIQWPGEIVWQSADEHEEPIARFNADILLGASYLQAICHSSYKQIGYRETGYEKQDELVAHRQALAKTSGFKFAYILAEEQQITDAATLGHKLKLQMAEAVALMKLINKERELVANNIAEHSETQALRLAEAQSQIKEALEQAGGEITAIDGIDTLYSAAVEFVRESRRASVSAVQRRFKIGYNRAARLIDMMEAQQVISAAGHNGSREVLQPPSEVTKSIYPLEVLAIVAQAFNDNPHTKTEIRTQALCDKANSMLLDKHSQEDILTELNTMLARCEKVEESKQQ